MTENKILIAEFARIIKEFGRKRRQMFEENLTFPNKSMHIIKEIVGSSNVKLRFFVFKFAIKRKKEFIKFWKFGRDVNVFLCYNLCLYFLTGWLNVSHQMTLHVLIIWRKLNGLPVDFYSRLLNVLVLTARSKLFVHYAYVLLTIRTVMTH
jgi:hypothetical protein